MIKIKSSIDNISEYQCGNLPLNAVKLKTPTTNDIPKKSFPIAVFMCVIMFISMFCKTFISRMPVTKPVFIMIGVASGIALLLVHELLHTIVYPKNAVVTIGKLKNKLIFVALASYPLKRSRFIIMCLLPLILGIVPLTIFLYSSPYLTTLNGIMFGMACIGMVSPYPDIYNVGIILKQAEKGDLIMFYKDEMYRIPNQKNTINSDLS
ncbi:MAG: DUF3267 domain-containing protein [Ruminococcus sp.]|nr:DUF3267 domain-containing protein [Ruminococcus sp.]